MEPLKPGRYRHFKGGVYTVIAVATHTETMEEMVVYRSDENGSVCGIEFVSLGETPGLGTKIRDNEDFRTQFYGISAPVGEADAISGATFSSAGLKSAVNTALEVYNENKEAILNGK